MEGWHGTGSLLVSYLRWHVDGQNHLETVSTLTVDDSRLKVDGFGLTKSTSESAITGSNIYAKVISPALSYNQDLEKFGYSREEWG